MLDWNSGAEDPATFTVDEVNKRIRERINGWEKLKFYDGVSHQRLFSLPKPIRNGIATLNEKLIVTEENPVFVH
jgi:spermidine synthase